MAVLTDIQRQSLTELRNSATYAAQTDEGRPIAERLSLAYGSGCIDTLLEADDQKLVDKCVFWVLSVQNLLKK